MAILNPEMRQGYKINRYKDVKYYTVYFKPQHLIVDKKGKPVHSFNSLKEIKKFIDEK